jgi:hypothetical protein
MDTETSAVTMGVTMPLCTLRPVTYGYETAVGRFRSIADMAKLDAGSRRSRMTQFDTWTLLIAALQKDQSINSERRTVKGESGAIGYM